MQRPFGTQAGSTNEQTQEQAGHQPTQEPTWHQRNVEPTLKQANSGSGTNMETGTPLGTGTISGTVHQLICKQTHKQGRCRPTLVQARHQAAGPPDWAADVRSATTLFRATLSSGEPSKSYPSSPEMEMEKEGQALVIGTKAGNPAAKILPSRFGSGVVRPTASVSRAGIPGSGAAGLERVVTWSTDESGWRLSGWSSGRLTGSQ